MVDGTRDLKGQGCPSPLSPLTFGNPLDLIHDDHVRGRRVCAQIDALAGGETPAMETVAAILAFLQNELPLHLEDEEEDLFPLLRRRCQPEDEINRAIARLTEFHRDAGRGAPMVAAALSAVAGGSGRFSDWEHASLMDYATRARRHLILEDAVIMPLARLRLTKDDLETLRLRMLQRRAVAG